jgi:uncharacterized membrane protein YgcG
MRKDSSDRPLLRSPAADPVGGPRVDRCNVRRANERQGELRTAARPVCCSERAALRHARTTRHSADAGGSSSSGASSGGGGAFITMIAS